ncbi:MFS transporter [Kineococcus gynurae]|uniref:MFS transporter n=1 Tax=Kineococcus gynurae TaxID=452979 RepID=A0ABV5LUK1_9ACTN
MTLLDVSIVNVALPSMQRSLGASAGELQWIVAGYALAFGLFLVPSGRLGDVFSRRTLFLVGLVAFTVTSAVAGLVESGTALAVVRLIQGAAAGILNPQVLGLLQQLFSGAERARAFGAFGTTVGISTAVGPLLGGLILLVFGEEHGWRGVFLVNVPIGLVLFPLAWRWLPRPTAAGPREAAAGTGPTGAAQPAGPRHRSASGRVHLDVVGLLLLAAAVTVAMLPFVLTEGSGGGAPAWRWALLPVAALLMAAFVLWERHDARRGREPVVSGDLVRTASFSLGAAVGIAYFAGFTGIFLVTTLYVQTGLGLPPLQAGLVLTPFALASAVTAQIGGRRVSTRGRRIVVVGLVLTLVGLVGADVVAATVPADAPTWLPAVLLGAVLAVAGAGSGLTISPNQTLALAEVPRRVAGVAGGVLQTGQRIGTAVGVAAVTSVFFAGVGGGRGAAVYGEALSAGLRVSVGCVVLALVLALVDARRRQDAPTPAGEAPGPGSSTVAR